MKLLKKFKLTKIIALTMIITVISCSEDDAPTLNANDFSITIDENQSEDTELGTIDASGTDGEFIYSITSQSPTGSIAIDATTGVITVADANNFDYETNPTITATINIMGNSITEVVTATISLNDIDDLESLLTDSKAAYIAAADGDWVAVTETEYSNMATSLNEVSKIGTTDALYDTTPSTTNTNAWTVANDAGANVPASSYVFAIKYYLNSGTDVTGFKIKQSATINDAYSDLGNALPIHSGTSETVYFILKGNSSQVSSESYLAVYKPSGSVMGILSTETYYFASNDTNTGFSNHSGYLFYQGLSTTQMQW